MRVSSLSGKRGAHLEMVTRYNANYDNSVATSGERKQINMYIKDELYEKYKWVRISSLYAYV